MTSSCGGLLFVSGEKKRKKEKEENGSDKSATNYLPSIKQQTDLASTWKELAANGFSVITHIALRVTESERSAVL